jgi:DNA-binding NtrC family response regulator
LKCPTKPTRSADDSARKDKKQPGFRRATSSILLIEDDDLRRIEALQCLLRSGYAVTPCSSVWEARQVLYHISHSAMAPQVVIMADHLEREGGMGLRTELAARFAGTRWLHYPRDRDIHWLAEQLGSIAEEIGRRNLRA